MIITITMNPSIDLSYTIEHFQLGKTNRFVNPVQSVGGKGINAGRTAALSGNQVVLTGFLGGDQGELVYRHLVKEKLFKIDMLETSGKTRNAISIMHDNDTHTEIIEEGPQISAEEIDTLLRKIELICRKEQVDLICISGSVNSKNQQLYLEMLNYIRKHISSTMPVFMDVSGQQLLTLLANENHKPSFIKPNIPELAELLEIDIVTKEEALSQLDATLFEGIDYILVSCGSEGGICKFENHYYDIKIPKIPIRNATGSGDASVGGFIHGVVNHFPIEETLRYSMACGMSNAQHGEVGIINQNKVKEFCQQIQVTKLT
ncbi:tagatose 6-phosphate kinase [Enterococcus sp. PF1-24]|uniref:1-phosphofructokinase family hexose kinase n=1 Tax=unclassified Enterococcus TaxID=2608891 RepID=UPI0024742712|nr:MULTISPECIES: 1-phosphofructokinase family hexose kinase [unclassified Enterococcus]MDH6364846.1 tagatose 6-phosphate kinase [Enterococcus sp. PFB1-1]MDH6401930.1 tagatose 6-phosphate kinase [Enterococcus sp. PF1-24]